MTRGDLALCLIGYAVIVVLLFWCFWRLVGDTFVDPEVREAEDQEQAEWLDEWARRR